MVSENHTYDCNPQGTFCALGVGCSLYRYFAWLTEDETTTESPSAPDPTKCWNFYSISTSYHHGGYIVGYDGGLTVLEVNYFHCRAAIRSVIITVLDDNTGLPLPGATVSGSVGGGTTDSSGIWGSADLNAAVYSYAVSMAGYTATGTLYTPLLSGNYTVTIRMATDPINPPVDPPVNPPYDPAHQGILTIHVVDANSPSVDIAGATVTVGSNSQTADSTGRAKFVVWLNYKYTYTAAKANYTTSTPATTGVITANAAYAVLLAPGATAPPICEFSATPRYGKVPLSVQFTDKSVNTPTSWLWVFGDGDTTGNTLQDPLHVYLSEGVFSVTLTATNAYGNNAKTKTDHIIVNEKIGTLQPNQRVMIMRDVSGKSFCVPVTSLQSPT